jgi:hypothetical protein
MYVFYACTKYEQEDEQMSEWTSLSKVQDIPTGGEEDSKVVSIVRILQGERKVLTFPIGSGSGTAFGAMI